MAWARDADTGEPRYILELDDSHRGAKCGCQCPSCGQPLTAVNAAKAEFLVRPHFRHPEGAQRDDCLVLASRAALLRQLVAGGYLELPRRRVSATATGISGEAYEAWVEQPPQKLGISQVNYRDRTQAVVTFDDGRQLLVLLTGMRSRPAAEASNAEQGIAMPTILLDVNDPSLAGMEPDELRKRLRLVPNAVCWRRHWDEDELLARAQLEARRKAQFHLDEPPDDFSLPPDMPPELRRETVLHFEVKRILTEERRIRVPGWRINVQVPATGPRALTSTWEAAPELLELDFVELELRFGSLIPDVTCNAWPVDGGPLFWPFLIEVAVTNPVDEVRLTKIREQGEAALEIDLGRTGGWVNRDELKRIVVDELAPKRWLFNPLLEERRAALLAELTAQVAEEAAALLARQQAAADRKRAVMAAPLEDLAGDYVQAAIALHDAYADTDADGRQTPEARARELAAIELMADVADRLALRGYPEAGNEDFIGYRGIVARILSCKLGRPVGYRVGNVMGVLNAIWQAQGQRRSFHSLFFVALRTYSPPMKPDQLKKVDGWAAEVRESIRKGETTFLRDPGYDRVLSLLFPEMADALAKPGGKRPDASEVAFERASRRAYFIEHQPRTDRAEGALLDTGPGSWWLKGRDLEAWERANVLPVSGPFATT